MCPNCDGQIPTVHYMAHIEQCYAAKHAQYEQRNDVKAKANIKKDKISMEMDDLLFSTPYKSECYPLNPLQSKIEEQSESDIESVSCLCPPDINDRKKVIASLIRKQNKYECNAKYKQQCESIEERSKELEIWHKVFTKMVPENDLSSSPSPIPIGHCNVDASMPTYLSMQSVQLHEENGDSEEEEEDEEEDSDDDIPIAQNLKKQNSQNGSHEIDTNEKIETVMNEPVQQELSLPDDVELKEDNASNVELYKQDYDKMHARFKRYYRRKKMKRMKKRHIRKLKLKQTGNYKLLSDKCDRYSVCVEKDKEIIGKLYGIFNKEAINDRFAPFCSFASSMKASKQLMRDMKECDVKTQHCGFLYDKPKKREDEMNQYEYFCHCRLDKNGQCPLHGNWKQEMYDKLVRNLKNETEQLFVLDCMLRQTNKMIWEETEKKNALRRQAECALIEQDGMSLLNELDALQPSCSIKIDAAQT